MRAEKIQTQMKVDHKSEVDYKGYILGISITLLLSILAGQIAKLPFFSIMGIMIISIMLGALWSNTFSLPKTPNVSLGVNVCSKKLLRAGIILLGLRLNLSDIIDSGISILLIDLIVIAFTMVFILSIGRAMNINLKLTTLIAAGTAICGAAAIVAVAPLIKSKQEQTAIAVTCIAIFGTIGALFYIFLFPYLPLSKAEYGILVGATLHELAHVVAASIPGGEVSGEFAILVKLGRVILLIPVAILISFIVNRKNTNNDKSFKNLPIPWFIFGFLLVSLINTLQLVPTYITNILLILSTYFLSMGMAGLGLNIKWLNLKEVGLKPIGLAIIGFIGLLAISPLFLFLYQLF